MDGKRHDHSAALGILSDRMYQQMLDSTFFTVYRHAHRMIP
jgi:hypothetical protein